MTKKQIEKMFNNMKESCECVKSLYDEGIYDYEESTKKNNDYRNKYMGCVNALLLLGMINGKLFDYAYELLKGYDVCIYIK